MGLDMNLYKRTYVQRWEHQSEESKFKVCVTKGGKTVKSIDPEKICYIEEEVGYWRKANAIHSWFVRNCARGEDDCKPVDVELSQLQELLETCKKVVKASKLVKGKVHNGWSYTKEEGKVDQWIDGKIIKDSSVAEELLPTTSGFFFGGTGYNEWYLEDIKRTIQIIENATSNLEGYPEFVYRASW